jgi:DNA-binding CsgD family transcriptional regulator
VFSSRGVEFPRNSNDTNIEKNSVSTGIWRIGCIQPFKISESHQRRRPRNARKGQVKTRRIPNIYLSRQEFAAAEEGLQRLSQAEYEILVGLCHSKSAKEIACARGVSTRTVESQKLSIARKLGADSPKDLFRLCLALDQNHARKNDRAISSPNYARDSASEMATAETHFR